MILEEEIVQIKKSLQEHDIRITQLEELFENYGEKVNKNVDFQEGLNDLAKAAGVSEERIKRFFKCEDDDLDLTYPIQGENEAEKQLRASLLILTAYSYYFNKKEIKSQDLRKKLGMLGIKSLTNLGHNLREHNKFLIPKGKTKSPNYSYRITYLEFGRVWQF